MLGSALGVATLTSLAAGMPCLSGACVVVDGFIIVLRGTGGEKEGDNSRCSRRLGASRGYVGVTCENKVSAKE